MTPTAPGQITNGATVGGNEPDPTPANNTVSADNLAGAGTRADIPTLSNWGFLALGLLLAAAGLALLLGTHSDAEGGSRCYEAPGSIRLKV